MFLYQKKVHRKMQASWSRLLEWAQASSKYKLGNVAICNSHTSSWWLICCEIQISNPSCQSVFKSGNPTKSIQSMISGLSSEEYRQSEPQFLKSTRFLTAWEALGDSGESSCILSPSIAALQVSPWSIPRCHHHPLLLKSGLSSSNLSRRWQKVRPFKRLF